MPPRASESAPTAADTGQAGQTQQSQRPGNRNRFAVEEESRRALANASGISPGNFGNEDVDSRESKVGRCRVSVNHQLSDQHLPTDRNALRLTGDDEVRAAGNRVSLQILTSNVPVEGAGGVGRRS